MRLRIILFLFTILISHQLLSQENNFILCSDGIDNDGDGWIDCEDSECFNLPNDGCTRCGEGTSFGDVVIEYVSGCPNVNPDPTGATGVADWDGNTSNNPQFVSLGQGGSIKIGFTNNQLTNSGDGQEDLWVFEIGPAVEASRVALEPADIFTENALLQFVGDMDNDGYYELGNIMGSTSGLDIDGVLQGFDAGELKFSAIEIQDIVDDACLSDTSGADIDAVCALSSIPRDCNGVPNGLAVIDACGECLSLLDTLFNQSCADCAGIPNGLAILDECGDCLTVDDPLFNQSCMDCAGVPNGTLVIDNCGECLDVNDPLFNQTCSDCLGALGGSAVIDECGECLDPTDPLFNQSCADCAGIPNGLAIIDACGDCFTPTDSLFNQACSDCEGVLFGAAIIDECGQCLNPSAPSFNKTCLKEIFIPNAFSPNGDGINDQFIIFKPPFTVATIRTYEIYSRWGELIYQAENLEFNEVDRWWTGEHRDQKISAGIFVYHIEAEFGDGEVLRYNGELTILK